MSKEIMVSVFCMAYNHEKYITECLQSLVSQETDFLYEILVHDDASTDHTAEIIRSFESRFPDLIYPIYQSENQYSKNVNIRRTFLVPKARGKYIATCEGDDYWTDPLKLQKQVDAMEQHPEIDMCTHAAVKVRDGVYLGFVAPSQEIQIFNPEMIIKGGGGLFATNSILYRRSMHVLEPQFIRFYLFDYSLQVWGSLRGGILYLPECMSAYRVMADGSWTSRMRKDKNARIAHLKKTEQMERILKDEIAEEYKKTVEDHAMDLHIKISGMLGDFAELRKLEYRKRIRQYAIKKRAKLFAQCCRSRILHK